MRLLPARRSTQVSRRRARETCCSPRAGLPQAAGGALNANQLVRRHFSLIPTGSEPRLKIVVPPIQVRVSPLPQPAWSLDALLSGEFERGDLGLRALRGGAEGGVA
jgi:hypothetical protein